MEKKECKIEVRFTKEEKEKLKSYCKKNSITISDLIRSSIQKIIKGD